MLCNARTFSRWLLYSAFLVSLIAIISGCSRTVVGGFVDSADKKYRVYGRVYGAYGRSFMDGNSKQVRISIVTTGGGEALLFRKEYRVNGSDVGWDATWDEHNNISVVVYDYGPGVDSTIGEKNGFPKHHLLTVTCHFDSKSGAFTEESSK